MDMEYVCTALCNISGLPVRAYKGTERVFYHTNVILAKDPLDECLPKVFSVGERVGYFSSECDYYYGVARLEDVRIVLGPTRQVPAFDWELKELAFKVNVPRREMDAFIRGMKSLPHLPITSVLQMLLLVDHAACGEKRSLADVYIQSGVQKEMAENLLKEEKAGAMEDGEGIESKERLGTLDMENKMMGYIRNGDVDGLNALFATMPAIRGGIIAKDEVRQAKNLLVVAATLASRASVFGGMECDDAFSLSDRYIRKSELLMSVDAVANLTYRLVMDYAERVRRLRYGKASSLSIKVTNYVRHHLSEPVTVERLAEELHRSKSRLSTAFKRETGENLSAFILRLKTEEGMELLKHTDRPISEISYYLGFSSQGHFSRVFKQYAGRTPGAYRADMRRV